MTIQPPFSLRLRAVIALTACAAHCAPASYAQNAAPHSLLGTWNWTVFSGKCPETLQYRADGVLSTTSGDAVTAWRYRLDAAPDARGFYKVVETLTRTNGQKDCHGDVVDDDDIAALEATRYIQFSPAKDRMVVCKTASLAACYGPLKREPPG